jgi:hypothetical protein
MYAWGGHPDASAPHVCAAGSSSSLSPDSLSSHLRNMFDSLANEMKMDGLVVCPLHGAPLLPDTAYCSCLCCACCGYREVLATRARVCVSESASVLIASDGNGNLIRRQKIGWLHAALMHTLRCPLAAYLVPLVARVGYRTHYAMVQ